MWPANSLRLFLGFTTHLNVCTIWKIDKYYRAKRNNSIVFISIKPSFLEPFSLCQECTWIFQIFWCNTHLNYKNLKTKWLIKNVSISTKLLFNTSMSDIVFVLCFNVALSCAQLANYGFALIVIKHGCDRFERVAVVVFFMLFCIIFRHTWLTILCSTNTANNKHIINRIEITHISINENSRHRKRVNTTAPSKWRKIVCIGKAFSVVNPIMVGRNKNAASIDKMNLVHNIPSRSSSPSLIVLTCSNSKIPTQKNFCIFQLAVFITRCRQIWVKYMNEMFNPIKYLVHSLFRLLCVRRLLFFLITIFPQWFCCFYAFAMIICHWTFYSFVYVRNNISCIFGIEWFSVCAWARVCMCMPQFLNKNLVHSPLRDFVFALCGRIFLFNFFSSLHTHTNAHLFEQTVFSSDFYLFGCCWMVFFSFYFCREQKLRGIQWNLEKI